MTDPRDSISGGHSGPVIKGIEAVSHSRSLPPVENWHPSLSGEMDLVVRANGNWVHEGGEIGRPELVRLFASIMRREDDGHTYLVTPVEKWRITVEDAAFQIVRIWIEGTGESQQVHFLTNCGDEGVIGDGHALRVAHDEGTKGFRPYVAIRHGLEGALIRSVAIELAELVVEGRGRHAGGLGLWSGGTFWPVASASAGDA